MFLFGTSRFTLISVSNMRIDSAQIGCSRISWQGIVGKER